MCKILLVLVGLVFSASTFASDLCGIEVNASEIIHRGSEFGRIGQEAEARIKTGVSKIILCPTEGAVYLISYYNSIEGKKDVVFVVESFDISDTKYPKYPPKYPDDMYVHNLPMGTRWVATQDIIIKNINDVRIVGCKLITRADHNFPVIISKRSVIENESSWLFGDHSGIQIDFKDNTFGLDWLMCANPVDMEKKHQPMHMAQFSYLLGPYFEIFPPKY